MGYSNHGFNATFSARGHGTKKAVCISITHVLEIIAAEDDAAFYRGYYPRATTTSPFSVGLEFATYALYTEFSGWLAAYGKKAAQGAITGAMRVTVPARNFDRYAVATSGITAGRGVEDVVYRMNLGFTGSREANASNAFASSQYIAPTVDIGHGGLYTPAGNQLTGSERGPDFGGDFITVDLSNPDTAAQPPTAQDVNANPNTKPYVGNM